MSTAKTWDFADAVEKLAGEKSALASSPEKALVGHVVAAEGSLAALRTKRQTARRVKASWRS